MKKKRLKTLQILLSAFGAAAFGGGILIAPQAASQGVRDGLTLCGQVVIPSLFPFLALSSFLVQSGLAQRAGHLLEPITKLLFRLPGAAGSAILMSLIGGYPALTASALLIGLCMRFLASKETMRESPVVPPTGPSMAQALVDAATQGCAGIVSICVWVILFSCIAALFSLLPLPSTLRILLQCFLEVTSGCASAAGKVPLPALALVLGWGGICVHCQVLHDVSKTKLSLPLFFCGRVANGLLACLISAGLFRLFPCETPVFSNHVQALPQAFAASAPVAAGMLFMCALLILEVEGRRKTC